MDQYVPNINPPAPADIGSGIGPNSHIESLQSSIPASVPSSPDITYDGEFVITLTSGNPTVTSYNLYTDQNGEDWELFQSNNNGVFDVEDLLLDSHVKGTAVNARGESDFSYSLQLYGNGG